MRKKSRKPAGGSNTLALACEARLHLFIREHSPCTLAKALGLTPTALGPVLATLKRELARQGIRLRLSRRPGRTRYQLLGYDRFVDRAWRQFNRSLKKFRARPSSPADPGAWSREDQELYGGVRLGL